MSILDRFLNRAGTTATTARRRAELAARGDRGPGTGRVIRTGLLGAAAGAVASFLLDPARGKARRARVRDQGMAMIRRLGRRAEQFGNRVRSDVEGKLAAARAARSPEARVIDDATLTDRVRSIVFRDASTPKGDLNVNVERGIVVVRGEVPNETTRKRILAEVAAVEGVWSVHDLTHLPGEEAVTVRAS